MYDISELESIGYDSTCVTDEVTYTDDLSGEMLVGSAIGGAILGYAVGNGVGRLGAWWAEKTEAGIQKAGLISGLKGAGIGALAAGGTYVVADALHGSSNGGGEEESANDWTHYMRDE